MSDEAPQAQVLGVPRLLIVVAEDLCADRSDWLRAVDKVHSAAALYREPLIGLQLRPRLPEWGHDETFPPPADTLPFDVTGFFTTERRPLSGMPLYLSKRVAWPKVDGRWRWHFPEAKWKDAAATRAAAPKPQVVRPWSAAVHDAESARLAASRGAELLVFAPVFETSWKASTPVGLEALREVVQATEVPVVALGGITPERVEPCMAVGAAGVAVASGIVRAPDIREAVGAYAEALQIPSDISG